MISMVAFEVGNRKFPPLKFSLSVIVGSYTVRLFAAIQCIFNNCYAMVVGDCSVILFDYYSFEMCFNFVAVSSIFHYSDCIYAHHVLLRWSVLYGVVFLLFKLLGGRVFIQLLINNFGRIKKSVFPVMAVFKGVGHHTAPVAGLSPTDTIIRYKMCFDFVPTRLLIFLFLLAKPVQGGPKIGTFLRRIISSNIDQFYNFFHCENQEKIGNITITKNLTAPSVCRYTTL